MRVSIALSLLLVSVVATSLQERQSPFPTCALKCFSSADLGGCVASDTACTCKNQKYVDSVTKCIYANCTGSDLTNSLTTAQQICRSVGVTLTSTPASTPTSSGTGSANSSAQATKTGSSASSSSSTSKSNDATYLHINYFATASTLGFIAVTLSFL